MQRDLRLSGGGKTRVVYGPPANWIASSGVHNIGWYPAPRRYNLSEELSNHSLTISLGVSCAEEVFDFIEKNC